MTLIAPQRRPERQIVSIKLDVRVLALLKAYGECIASTQEHVISEALIATFAADRAFHEWMTQAERAEAQGLATLLAERPRSMAGGAGKTSADAVAPSAR